MSRKIHSRPSSIPQIQTSTLSPEEQLELDFDICCCIEEIENILSKNATEKQKKLGEVSLKILKNPAETFIKKKQIMRQWFGDYRKKFDSKKKQMITSLNDSKATFKQSGVPVKSVFYRKHELKNDVSVIGNGQDSDQTVSDVSTKSTFSFKASDNSFKFNFQL